MDSLIPEIEAVLVMSDPDSKYIEQLELDALSDYIVNRHHSYVRENIPFLQQGLEKLCNAHGDNHPELFDVKEMFDGAAENLTAHIQKEELVLFPYIRKMVKYKQDGGYNIDEPGWVLQPISMMEGDGCFHKCGFGHKNCNNDSPCTTVTFLYATIFLI